MGDPPKVLAWELATGEVPALLSSFRADQTDHYEWVEVLAAWQRIRRLEGSRTGAGACLLADLERAARSLPNEAVAAVAESVDSDCWIRDFEWLGAAEGRDESELDISAEALRLFSVLDTWRLAFVGAELLATTEDERRAVRDASLRLEVIVTNRALENPGVFASIFEFVRAHLEAFREDLFEQMPELAAITDVWETVRSVVEDLPDFDLESMLKPAR